MRKALSSADEVSFPKDAHAAFAEVEDESYWFNHRNDVIERVIRRFPPSGEILDIGGGNGVVSQHLQRTGLACAVLEPDADGARMARKRGLRVLELKFNDYEPPAALDACSFFDVIEHIESSVETLRRACKLLKPGGYVYITVPAHAWLWSAEDVSAGHFRRYTIASLSREVEAAGFSVRFSSYFFGFLMAPVALLRSLPTLLGLAKTDAVATADAHRPPPAAIASVMNASFRRERDAMQQGRALPLGTSIILVAQKPG